MQRFYAICFSFYAVFCAAPIEAQWVGRIVNSSGQFTPGLSGTTIRLSTNLSGAPGTFFSLPLSPTHTFNLPNAIPTSTSYLVASKDDEWTRGVDVLDALKIQRHILGLEPLNSPFRILAADINSTMSVTVSDIVEMRKLILGAFTTFPNTTSFKFLPRVVKFPNPAFPFSGVLNATHPQFHLMHPDSIGFIGFKMGDVTGDATAPKSNKLPVEICYQNRVVKTGDVFEVEFTNPEIVSGIQFTLEHPDLELLEIISGPGSNIQDFQKHNRAVTCAWIKPDQSGPDFKSFKLKFRALSNGKLLKFLKISDAITPSVAYDSDFDQLKVILKNQLIVKPKLQEDDTHTRSASITGVQQLVIAPNPVQQTSQVSFELSEASEVQIQLVDLQGRIVFAERQTFEAGEQNYALVRPTEIADGFYTLLLKSKWNVQSCKVQFLSR
jgi:hypothetical protein